MTELLTPEQVAERFRVEHKTVLEWLRLGKIKGVKIAGTWRIHANEWEEMLSNRKEQFQMNSQEELFSKDRNWTLECLRQGGALPEVNGISIHHIDGRQCRRIDRSVRLYLVGKNQIELPERSFVDISSSEKENFWAMEPDGAQVFIPTTNILALTVFDAPTTKES